MTSSYQVSSIKYQVSSIKYHPDSYRDKYQEPISSLRRESSLNEVPRSASGIRYQDIWIFLLIVRLSVLIVIEIRLSATTILCSFFYKGRLVSSGGRDIISSTAALKYRAHSLGFFTKAPPIAIEGFRGPFGKFSTAALKYRAHSLLFFTKAKAVWKNSLHESLFLSSSILLIFPQLKYCAPLLLFFSKPPPKASSKAFGRGIRGPFGISSA
jgi:hypothetical protein